MTVEPTSIEGLLVVRWPLHTDERGFFRQTVQAGELAAALGRPVRWAQANHARSRPGVIRGFHAEPWDKCVDVAHGSAMAAVADIRPESPSFGEVAVFRLGDPPGERVRLFIGQGLANACGAIGDGEVDYLYDVSEEWRPVHDHAIAFDDPDLAVPWPIREPIVSPSDRAAPRLRDRFPEHPRFVGGPAPSDGHGADPTGTAGSPRGPGAPDADPDRALGSGPAEGRS